MNLVNGKMKIMYTHLENNNRKRPYQAHTITSETLYCVSGKHQHLRKCICMRVFFLYHPEGFLFK